MREMFSRAHKGGGIEDAAAVEHSMQARRTHISIDVQLLAWDQMTEHPLLELLSTTGTPETPHSEIIKANGDAMSTTVC